MPLVSLVVCLHGEREHLERLLQKSSECYDDLVVVHDGPDTTGIRDLVTAAGGRFFERPREYQQEPHWAFAWQQTAHDWILRLDADEFPSPEMKTWLWRFREQPNPPPDISGYTCSWPLWNGQQAISKKWPADRKFLFNRQRVRFFGMVEQSPVADAHFQSLDFALQHQPVGRKAFGLRNIVFRKRAGQWRKCLARSLQGKPTDLPCWRWTDPTWPAEWEAIRQHPLLTAIRWLIRGPLAEMRNQWRIERRLFPFIALSYPLHRALICLLYWRLRQRTS